MRANFTTRTKVLPLRTVLKPPEFEQRMPHADDPYNLQRFVHAQSDCYEQALAELRAGRKETHWMWFIFPQFAGLGLSAMSQTYAIQSLDEARAYLNHPLLGPRLIVCVDLLLSHSGRSAFQILGSPDDLKLRSSATLFAAVATDNSCFARLLEKYFEGQADPRTLELIRDA